ncbi:hypothetical protein IKF63_01870 [Candidatus Saccharibacteria bacterium]|nr:hypothetical protein [Candidatus Saccharibacteria bacterium]
MNPNERDTKKALDYILAEENPDEDVANQLLLKVSKYNDIFREFLLWIDSRTFPPQNVAIPVKSGNYTAKDIHDLNPKFSGLGVYNFLVTLRDNPAFAETAIKSGFPVV